MAAKAIISFVALPSLSVFSVKINALTVINRFFGSSSSNTELTSGRTCSQTERKHQKRPTDSVLVKPRRNCQSSVFYQRNSLLMEKNKPFYFQTWEEVTKLACLYLYFIAMHLPSVIPKASAFLLINQYYERRNNYCKLTLKFKLTEDALASL